MARTRSTTAPRLNRDATRLVSLAQALNRSGSRIEDVYWEAQLAEAIGKLLRPGSDGPLEAALDHLAQRDIGAYEVLIEQAETLSESMKTDKNGVRHDVLLLVAPVVAWTRYAIPTGPIPAAAQQALLAQLHGHVLAANTRVALLPHLVSIDQMPRTFAETAQWMQRLAGQALGGAPTRTIIDTEAETANMLADTRYLVAAVAVPEHAPI
ncbi:PF11062 domain protein, partial [Bordetella hinzii CA90 BAL1384]